MSQTILFAALALSVCYGVFAAMQALQWRGKYHDLLDKMRQREQVYRRAHDRVRQSHDH